MAVRTEDETLDLVQAVTKMIADEHTNLTGTFTTNINSLTTQLAVGDEVDENTKIKNQLNTVIRAQENVWVALEQLARSSYPAIGRLASSPNLSSQNLNLDFFQQYAVDTANNIERRGFTKDTATTITGSGAGLITLSTLDVNGSLIDVGHVEDLTFRCSRDNSEGATAGREQFTAEGSDSSPFRWLENGTNLGRSYDYPYGQVNADFGSGLSRQRTGGILTSAGGASSTGNLVRNGDFESPIGAATGTGKLTQWDITTGDAGVADESVDPILGENSLAITTDFVMDQNVSSGRLKPRVAYFISLKAERLASATGSLTVKVMDRDEGTTHGTVTVDISTLTNDVPVPIQPVHFIVPTDAEDLKVQVELASLAVGTIKVDDVVVAPVTLIDGYLVSIMDGTTLDSSGNAQGRYKNGDEFVIQTSSAETGTIQKFYFNRPSQRYIESDAAASAGWEDPA